MSHKLAFALNITAVDKEKEIFHSNFSPSDRILNWVFYFVNKRINFLTYIYIIMDEEEKFLYERKRKEN